MSRSASPCFLCTKNTHIWDKVPVGKWMPNAKMDSNGHWHCNGKNYGPETSRKGLCYGGKCDPIDEVEEASEYYYKNLADIPILPKSWSKDAFSQGLYDELVKDKEDALRQKNKESNQTQSAELFATFKTFLGMTIGSKIEVDPNEQGEGQEVVQAFEPKGGLPGFEKYMVYATPKSHRVFKIVAIQEGGTETNARCVVKYIMSRYAGLKFREKSNGRGTKGFKWECKMVRSEGAHATRTLSVRNEKQQCVVSLTDSSGVDAAKNEAKNRCVKCKGSGSISIAVKCHLCQGTQNQLCNDCKGSKLVPCQDCGSKKKKCGYCHGKGKVKCMLCNGTGRRTYCSNCTDGKEERQVKCPTCHGSGKCE